jgi:hypothetical protein
MAMMASHLAEYMHNNAIDYWQGIVPGLLQCELCEVEEGC